MPAGRQSFSLPVELSPVLARSRLSGLPIEWLAAGAVPQPYRRLLVHDHDMTSELERFHRDRISLRVLHSLRDGDRYLREVTLHAAVSEKTVEYGFIEILLGAFPRELRPQILAGETPLGAILNAAGFSYGSAPQGFLGIPPEGLREVFGPAATSEILYGRYNHLIRADGALLARIIEILPRNDLQDANEEP